MADVNSQIRLIIFLLLFLFLPVIMNGNETARVITIKKRDSYALRQYRLYQRQQSIEPKGVHQNSRTTVSYNRPRPSVAETNSYNGKRAATNVKSTEKHVESNNNLVRRERYRRKIQLDHEMPRCEKCVRKTIIMCNGLSDKTAVCLCLKMKNQKEYGGHRRKCYTKKAKPNRQNICKQKKHKCRVPGKECVNYGQLHVDLLLCQFPAGKESEEAGKTGVGVVKTTEQKVGSNRKEEMPRCEKCVRKTIIMCNGLSDKTAVCLCLKMKNQKEYGPHRRKCYTKKAKPNRQNICKQKKHKCRVPGKECVNYGQLHVDLVLCQFPAGKESEEAVKTGVGVVKTTEQQVGSNRKEGNTGAGVVKTTEQQIGSNRNLPPMQRSYREKNQPTRSNSNNANVAGSASVDKNNNQANVAGSASVGSNRNEVNHGSNRPKDNGNTGVGVVETTEQQVGSNRYIKHLQSTRSNSNNANVAGSASVDKNNNQVNIAGSASVGSNRNEVNHGGKHRPQDNGNTGVGVVETTEQQVGSNRYIKQLQSTRSNSNNANVAGSASVDKNNNQVNIAGSVSVGSNRNEVNHGGKHRPQDNEQRYRTLQQAKNLDTPGYVCLDCKRKHGDTGNNIIQNNQPQDKRISKPYETQTVVTIHQPTDSVAVPNNNYADKPINSVPNPCNPNPCQNGGTCKIESSNDGGYECDCRQDFRGKYCHEVTVKCDLLGCDKTEDCVSTPLGGTCICVIDNVGKICVTDTGLSSEWDKVKMVVSERTVHGAETVLGIVASVVVFILFIIIHCHRVNSRRSTMQKKYEKAKRKQSSVDPPPGWCDVSSHVLQQTFCCKSDSIVDNYLPKKKTKGTKARKKKKEDNQKQTKVEDGVGPDNIDIEITKRHNSRTGFGSNLNQSGNQSENTTRNSKTRSGHSSLVVSKLFRKHSSAKPLSQNQPIYFDEELHMFGEKLNQKKSTRRNNILDKELERRHWRTLHTRVNKSKRNYHSRPDNLELETNVVDKDDSDQYINEDNFPHLSEATSKTNQGKGIQLMQSDWFDHSHNTQAYCSKLDCNNVKEWSSDERRAALKKHIDDDDDDEIIDARKKMGAIEHKMQKLRKSREHRQADIKQTLQETEIVDTRRDEWFQNSEHYNNPNVGKLMEYLDYCNTAHDGKGSLATFDNIQRETGENVCQNRNVNTNIEEPLFSVPQYPSYYSDSKECDCLDSYDYYSFDNNPVYNDLADRQFRQDRCGFTYGNFNEKTDTQTFAEDIQFFNEDRFTTTPQTDYHLSKEKSGKVDYSNQNDDNSLEDGLKIEPKNIRSDGDVHLCLSEPESRQFYHVPDRELYGIWSTNVEIPVTAQDDEHMKTFGNKKESLQGTDVKDSEQKITQTMSFDASTDQHYLKSFEKDGQKLYYVDGDSQYTEFNFNQNHELVNYADSMLSDQNAMHENFEQNVDNEVFFVIHSPIDTSSNSDSSDACVGDTLSTLKASATDSEAYASEDNTLVAPCETEI